MKGGGRMSGIGVGEIAVVTAIILLLWGPSQVPKMGRALGETIREFRGVGRELQKTLDEPEDTSRG